MSTSTKDEAESLVGLGKDLAEDATRLVHAEIRLVKAEVVATLKHFAVGAGLALGALIFLPFAITFTLGTFVEGVNGFDNWPLYLAGAALLGAALCFAMATAGRAVIAGATVIGLLACGGGYLWFNWGFIPAAIALGVGVVALVLATASEEASAWVFTTLAKIALLGILVMVVWFYVGAIIGGNGEVGRRGWAIAAASFAAPTVVMAAAAWISIKRTAAAAKSSVSEIKEDASWVTQLMKRDKSAS